jgi:ketosteroid isomerase-like protein
MESGGLWRDTARAMSKENVEVVRRANSAFNTGDDDALAQVYAPDAELRDLANAPDQASVLKGRDAIQVARDLWTAAFDEFRADVTEYTDVGDAVICAVRWYGRGKGSGMSIDVSQFDLYVLQEGHIVRATLGFRSKAEALEAARPPE